MAYGPLWRDLFRVPQVADLGNITLATTQKMLWTPGAGNPMGNFPSNFWVPGRTVKLTAALKWTSGTAGNITFGMAYGSADAAAVNVTSATHAAVASVGPFLVYAQGYATCRTDGTAGTLSMWGMVHFPIDLMLSTVGNDMGFPSAGGTVVSTFDSTVATNGLFFQASRSAGTDTVAPVGLLIEVLN